MSPDAVSIELTGPETLPAIEPLWWALYAHQRAHGQILPVPDGAFAEWSRGLAPILGRFAVLVVASRAGVPVGFVAGRTRNVPPYLGGGQAGFIGEVFTAPEARGCGVATRMLEEAGKWFAAQGVQRLELQVIPGNAGAIQLYRRLGWREELIQMVLTLPVG
jgi:GNAT superfamily N-acetyltransferase